MVLHDRIPGFHLYLYPHYSRPARGEQALTAAEESGGRIVAASDDDILAMQTLLAADGVWVEPAITRRMPAPQLVPADLAALEELLGEGKNNS